MQIEKAYRSSNAKGCVPSRVYPAVWPPKWLSTPPKLPTITSEPVQETIPPPPPSAAPSDDPPELAAWNEIKVEEAGEPCPKCGSLEKWWDPNGKEHCQQCCPIRRALALADLAARIRRRKR